MEMLSGAEMVVQSLVDQGVKQVFGYPGGAVLDIYDALHTLGGIDHVLVRHEQAAVHMADGLARATGEVGVVLVTSGPGATNAIASTSWSPARCCTTSRTSRRRSNACAIWARPVW